MTWQSDYSRDYEVKNHMECQNRSDKYIWSPHDAYFYKGLSELIVDIDR
ncbi:TPA: helix-turn-helix transcriptional regulator, partial [Escherichia coli]|nr:helix-turn-helix transcriptional regulator [Escherichia coli]